MMKKPIKTKKAPIGPPWLRLLLFTAASLCMGLAVTAAMQWIAIGTLPGVLEWAREYPAHLLMTALLWAVPVFLLGTLTGRLWAAALPAGAAGLALALVDHFKNAINGTPLELADFGLAAQAGNVAGLAGDLTPPEDFYLAAAALLCAVLVLYTNDTTVIYSEPSLESAVVLQSCGAGIPIQVTGITSNGFFRVCVSPDGAQSFIIGSGLSQQ